MSIVGQCKWVSAELDSPGLASACESALGIVVASSGHRSDKVFPQRSEEREKGQVFQMERLQGARDTEGLGSKGPETQESGQQEVRGTGSWTGGIRSSAQVTKPC